MSFILHGLLLLPARSMGNKMSTLYTLRSRIVINSGRNWSISYRNIYQYPGVFVGPQKIMQFCFIWLLLIPLDKNLAHIHIYNAYILSFKYVVDWVCWETIYVCMYYILCGYVWHWLVSALEVQCDPKKPCWNWVIPTWQ